MGGKFCRTWKSLYVFIKMFIYMSIRISCAQKAGCPCNSYAYNKGAFKVFNCSRIDFSDFFKVKEI